MRKATVVASQLEKGVKDVNGTRGFGTNCLHAISRKQNRQIETSSTDLSKAAKSTSIKNPQSVSSQLLFLFEQWPATATIQAVHSC